MGWIQTPDRALAALLVAPGGGSDRHTHDTPRPVLHWEQGVRLTCSDGLTQEAYKGEIQCLTLPNQICFLTNHNKFHAANIQLLLLSSNQNTVVHRK